MSAPTVSITAALRRREGLSGKKIGVELDEGEAEIPLENGGTEHDVSGKDLNHTVKRDALVEKAKEAPHIRKALGNSTVNQRRSKKVVTKSEKRRWQTVLVVLKNLLLIVVVFGLVHLIRKMALNSADVSIGTMIGISEFEVRIAEVESFVKKTAKMVQVQVDAVDMKIEREVTELKKEMNRVEEKGNSIASQVEKLGASNHRLEEAVGKLAAIDVLTKQEFRMFYDELMKTVASESGHGNVTLDDVIAVAKDIVDKEINRHAADGLGMVDYALAAGGAVVVRHSETIHKRWFDTGISRVHPDASKMLTPSFGEPGQCFPMKGSTGFVEIRLRTAIIPTAITLEHVSKSVCYDPSSAPKDFRVLGWLQGRDSRQMLDTERMLVLGELKYDLNKSFAQTYSVSELAASSLIDTVRLDIMSNHGNPSFTCIYRLRVHGHEPDSVAMMAAQP